MIKTKLGFAALILLTMTACSVMNSVLPKNFSVTDLNPMAKGAKAAWDGVTILAADDANLNTPVALDLVLIRDESVLTVVSAMASSKWFGARQEILKTFPQGLKYKSVEVAPGQTLRLLPEDYSGPRLVGVILFADYLTAGEHRIRVDQMQGELVVQLADRDFNLAQHTAP